MEWAQARACFEAAVAHDAGAEALEGLSLAAWWLDDAATMFEARERAFALYRRVGDCRAAARMATLLGIDHYQFRGEAAVGNGWFRRAERLLEGLSPCPEHGWLWISVYRDEAEQVSAEVIEALQRPVCVDGTKLRCQRQQQLIKLRTGLPRHPRKRRRPHALSTSSGTRHVGGVRGGVPRARRQLRELVLVERREAIGPQRAVGAVRPDGGVVRRAVVPAQIDDQIVAAASTDVALAAKRPVAGPDQPTAGLSIHVLGKRAVQQRALRVDVRSHAALLAARQHARRHPRRAAATEDSSLATRAGRCSSSYAAADVSPAAATFPHRCSGPSRRAASRRLATARHNTRSLLLINSSSLFVDRTAAPSSRSVAGRSRRSFGRVVRG